jgi:hypothetical protein
MGRRSPRAPPAPSTVGPSRSWWSARHGQRSRWSSPTSARLPAARR